MGEAKRRKAHDPSYGRPKRGLIVSPPIEIDGRRLYVKTSFIDKQELRFSLLFWDRLVWPSSRTFYFTSGPDEQYLENIGVLSRPDYTFFGDAASGIANGFIRAFQDFNAKEPGQWAMMHGENSLILHNVRMPRNMGTVVEMHRAIPVPNVDVPLDELMTFKIKRQDELINLRNHLDDLIAAVELASDKEAELQKLTKEIDVACSQVLRVCHEWRFPVRLSSWKTNVELRPFQTLAGTIGALAIGQMQSLPLSAQVLTGMFGAAAASAPALKISADVGWLGLKRPASPFRYVSTFHKELF